MARIYLSSTYADLIEHRQAVYGVLRQMRHDVISMEDYGATDERPLDKCLADVASCDLYVGVFAWRYGFIPPGQEKSITELEYREADRTEKPRLIFMLKEDAPWPRTLMDTESKAIDTLRASLRLNHTLAFFSTPDDLARAVSVAVANTLDRDDDQSDETRSVEPAANPAQLAFYRDCLGRMTAELGSQIRFYSLAGSALFTFGLIILVVGALIVGEPVLGIGGTLISAITVFPLTTVFSTRKKKVVLDSYEMALQRTPPATDALLAVRRFLDHQLAT